MTNISRTLELNLSWKLIARWSQPISTWLNQDYCILLRTTLCAQSSVKWQNNLLENHQHLRASKHSCSTACACDNSWSVLDSNTKDTFLRLMWGKLLWRKFFGLWPYIFMCLSWYLASMVLHLCPVDCLRDFLIEYWNRNNIYTLSSHYLFDWQANLNL